MYSESPFEEVHTIDDWYDGPRSGFAQYHGVPHHYRSLYLDYDDWDADEDRFELVQVPTTVLDAAIEASAIFDRWDAVRQAAGATWKVDPPKSEFGTLPEDRQRYAALRVIIVPYEVADHPEGFVVRGRFERGCKHIQWRDDPSSGPSNVR
jgi:hypothetical protein